MTDFDEQILAVRRYIREKKGTEGSVAETLVPTRLQELVQGLPVEYSSDRKPFVLLKEDTFVELGNPVQGSASMVLVTRQAALIRNGLITRIGPDIPASEGKSLPLGQAILVGSSGLEDRELASIQRAADLAHCLEGYMTRQVPRKLWSRVSREAAAKGFCFETLGRAIMAQYRQLFDALEAIEILFATSSKADVQDLEKISLVAAGKSLSIRKLVRTQDGEYECEGLDCDTCSEKEICDSIREVVVIRKKGKVTGIQVVR